MLKTAISYLNLPITKRHILKFSSGKTTVDNAWEAKEIASTVHHFLKQIYNANPNQIIHFFCAIPVGLAVLIGTQLKNLPPIQTYNFNNSTQVYSPSCLLLG